LGWELRLVRARRDALEWAQKAGGTATRLSDVKFWGQPNPAIPSISFWRVWLGDEPVVHFAPPLGAKDSEIDRAIKLVPEATTQRQPFAK
jgi:hypothetical protein